MPALTLLPVAASRGLIILLGPLALSIIGGFWSVGFVPTVTATNAIMMITSCYGIAGIVRSRRRRAVSPGFGTATVVLHLVFGGHPTTALTANCGRDHRHRPRISSPPFDPGDPPAAAGGRISIVVDDLGIEGGPMRTLILGGGGFLGYHAVTEALAAGHEVTVFNRSGKAPVDGVTVIAGDRGDDLSGLRGSEWDIAFDTFNDFDPGAPAIRATAKLLSGAVGAYGYVSGMSVYAPSGPDRPNESGPVRRQGVEPDSDRLQARSLAKLAGEAAVAEFFDGPALFPRVGIMVGPRGRRFNYWPVRMAGAFSGELSTRILVPGDPSRPVQYSDARDIAAWSLSMLAQGRGGTYNTVGPGRPDTLQQVLAACAQAAGGDLPQLDLVVERDEDALRADLHDVDEEDRPLWFPEDQIPQAAIDSSAALAAGLSFRSAYDTAAQTLAWAQDAGDPSLTDTFGPRETVLLRGRR